MVDAGSSSRWCVVVTTARPGSSATRRSSARQQCLAAGEVETRARARRAAAAAAEGRARGRSDSVCARRGSSPRTCAPPVARGRTASSSCAGSLPVGGAEAVLEVADRLRGARVHDLPDREQRREAAAGASIDEPDLLAQAEHVGVPERPTEDRHRALARELDRAGHREQGRLARAVRSERTPSARPRGTDQSIASRIGTRVPEAACQRQTATPVRRARCLDPPGGASPRLVD